MNIKGKVLSFAFVLILGAMSTIDSPFIVYSKSPSKKDTSEYVFYDALNTAGKESYKTAVVDMGKIEDRVSVTAKPYFQKSENVTIPVELGSVVFKEMLVKSGDKVKKGTPVVRFTTKIDDTSLKEQTLELKRLQDVYNNFIDTQTKGLREQERALDAIVDKLDKKVASAEYRMAKVVYEISRQNQQRQIERCKDENLRLKTLQKTTEILAPVDGYVESVADLKSGTEIDHSKNLVKIVDPTTVLFKIPDENSEFKYNMHVTLKEKSTEDGENKTISGKIVASYLKTDDEGKVSSICYVKPDDIKLKINLKAKSFDAVVEKCVMENVLVLPNTAIEGGDESLDVGFTNVNVSVDGSLINQDFIPGFYDAENCQVVAGLDKGTKVVLRK